MEHDETCRTQNESGVARMPDERIGSGRDERVRMPCASRCARAWPWIGACVELAEGVVGCVTEERAGEGERRSRDGHERQGWEER